MLVEKELPHERGGASVKNHECNGRNPTPTWQPQGGKVGWAGKACPFDHKCQRHYHRHATIAWTRLKISYGCSDVPVGEAR